MALRLESIDIKDQKDVLRVYHSHREMFELAIKELFGGTVKFAPNVERIGAVWISGQGFIVNIKDEDKLVGYAICTFTNHVFYSKRYLSIDSLYIFPSYRTAFIIQRVVSLLKAYVKGIREVDSILLTVSNTVYNKKKSGRKFRCDKIYTFDVR